MNNKNDCNGDGDYVDGTDDQDCNDNGKLDVTVKMTSDAEVAGEIAILDQISPGSPVYKTNFPYSTLYNSPGSLFVVQSGTSAPVVTALYNDRNDGTGIALQERPGADRTRLRHFDDHGERHFGTHHRQFVLGATREHVHHLDQQTMRHQRAIASAAKGRVRRRSVTTTDSRIRTS